MLNAFPSLMDFHLFAPMIIRVVAGLVFIDMGLLKLVRERARWLTLYNDFLKAGRLVLMAVALVEIVGGIMLFFGYMTQVAALALSLLTFLNVYLEWKDEAFVKRDLTFHVMLFAMTLSLLFSGGGFFAVDVPFL